MATRKVALEGVLLTPEAATAWIEAAKRISDALKAARAKLDPSQVGEEYAEYNDQTGVLTIKCQIGPMVASLDVPRNHWSWNQ